MIALQDEGTVKAWGAVLRVDRLTNARQRTTWTNCLSMTLSKKRPEFEPRAAPTVSQGAAHFRWAITRATQRTAWSSLYTSTVADY